MGKTHLSYVCKGLLLNEVGYIIMKLPVVFQGVTVSVVKLPGKTLKITGLFKVMSPNENEDLYS